MADADAERASDQEARRLRAATALAGAWKDADDPRLSRLTRLAARLFDAPRAALMLIEPERIRLAEQATDWLKPLVIRAGGVINGGDDAAADARPQNDVDQIMSA